MILSEPNMVCLLLRTLYKEIRSFLNIKPTASIAAPCVVRALVFASQLLPLIFLFVAFDFARALSLSQHARSQVFARVIVMVCAPSGFEFCVGVDLVASLVMAAARCVSPVCLVLPAPASMPLDFLGLLLACCSRQLRSTAACSCWV